MAKRYVVNLTSEERFDSRETGQYGHRVSCFSVGGQRDQRRDCRLSAQLWRQIHHLCQWRRSTAASLGISPRLATFRQASAALRCLRSRQDPARPPGRGPPGIAVPKRLSGETRKVEPHRCRGSTAEMPPRTPSLAGADSSRGRKRRRRGEVSRVVESAIRTSIVKTSGERSPSSRPTLIATSSMSPRVFIRMATEVERRTGSPFARAATKQPTTLPAQARRLAGFKSRRPDPFPSSIP